MPQVQKRRKFDHLVIRNKEVRVVSATNPIMAMVKSGIALEKMHEIVFLGRKKGQEYRYEIDGELVIVS